MASKEFVNSVIDTTAIILLATGLTHAVPMLCKKGGKVDRPRLEFSGSEALYLRASAIFISGLYGWNLLPLLN